MQPQPTAGPDVPGPQPPVREAGRPRSVPVAADPPAPPSAGASPDPLADPLPDPPPDPLTDPPAGQPAASASGLPRWFIVLAGLAVATIAVAGLRSIAWLLGPVLLALVVVIALAPVQSWLIQHGWPRWASATVLLVLVWSVLLGFVGLLVLSVAQLATLLPRYSGRATILLGQLGRDLHRPGLLTGQLSDLVSKIDYGQLVGMATNLLGRLTDAATTLLLLLSALVFMVLESGGFGRRLALVGAERPHIPIALGLFARGTRSYLWVSTVFGALVAVCDGIGLTLLGVPAAALWAVLSFITNYVPNIGFVLGLIPPAVLGLLVGGWGKLIAVVVLYAVLNFLIQTLIQPRFVGDSVGLSTTVTFVTLLFWGWVMGALGALLAIPLTLLVKALLVDVDPRAHWIDVLLREEPRPPRTRRARERARERRSAIASVRALHHRHRPVPVEGDTRPDLQKRNVGPS